MTKYEELLVILNNPESIRCTFFSSHMAYNAESDDFPSDSIIFNDRTQVEEPIKEVSIKEIQEGVITHLNQILLENVDLICPVSYGTSMSSGTTIIPIHINPSRFRPLNNLLNITDSSRLSKLDYTPGLSVRSIAADRVEFYFARNQ